MDDGDGDHSNAHNLGGNCTEFTTQSHLAVLIGGETKRCSSKYQVKREDSVCDARCQRLEYFRPPH